MSRPSQTKVVVLLVMLAASSGLGCAGYAGSVQGMRTALQSGDKLGALKQVNDALEVKKDDELPEKLKGDNALLVLERATIKQALGRYQPSAADFQIADKHLELLDLKNDTAGNIAKWIFSDDATVYKAPAYEKLLLSTLNMLNYLAKGDLEGARVESRRLAVMQRYLSTEEGRSSALLGVGSFLAGFAFEMSGQAEQALQFYGDALSTGSYPSLTGPLTRLAGCSSVRSEAIEQLLASIETPRTCESRSEGQGTILVVASAGLAPHKEAVRLPIGAAITLAGLLMTPAETSRAQSLAAQGLLTFVNYPDLKVQPSHFSRAAVTIDGRPVPTDLGLDVSGAVIAEWEAMRPKVVFSAIVRAITRFAAAQATEQVVKGASGSGIGGLLAALAVQGTMTVMDTPDTRSWVTLPGKIFVARLEVQKGEHEVAVSFGSGARFSTRVTIKPGGFAVVPAMAMR
ncbi:MAG: hypothetical protein MUC50_05170 [Myxococcota bacterium]|nr:hypothetical protein [Myxococcota bacterium]